jgi:pyruvate formate lyase activating enzyme
MTGRIFNIKKFAIHDGPGIRTTIFFSGCSLSCIWCHNPESIAILQNENCEEEVSFITKNYSIDELMEIIKKDTIFFDESGGGVTFSGGEPLLQIDFVNEIIELCRKNNISTAIDTCGYIPTGSLKKVYEKTDLFLYDMKLFDNGLHEKYTGVSNKLIFKNLELLSSLNCKLIIRIPLIPGITDQKLNIVSIAKYLTENNIDHPVELLPYNEFAADKYRRMKMKSKIANLRTQSAEQLNEIKMLISSFGINVKLNG